ncbi:MAG: hypothetical protein SGBAC_003434 [Bacillariaceae sp.]
MVKVKKPAGRIKPRSTTATIRTIAFRMTILSVFINVFIHEFIDHPEHLEDADHINDSPRIRDGYSSGNFMGPQAPENALRSGIINPLDTTMKNPKNVFVDKRGHQYQALVSPFLLGNYSRHEGHGMDAVIMASAPDSALAVCVHNLYHLQGFRRFIFVVNDAKAHCQIMFDLLPQHGGPQDKKHICLQHNSFYTDAELKRLWNEKGDFHNIHSGPPEKVLRGGKYYDNPRMGWYLQQFSKMLISRLVPDLSEQYLAIDSDIIPVRPLEYIQRGYDGKLTILMPQVQKKPDQWRDFSRLVFPELELQKSKLRKPNKNFVVGWMIFDRTVLRDMVATVGEALLREEQLNDPFPFNVLQVGNELIKENNYFSEFYTYAVFAFNHTKVNYVEKFFEPPHRNRDMHESCVLDQTTYKQAQDDSFTPPWKIWEEHKYHRFDSCPEGAAYFNFSTIGIWHDFHPPPWGGGNQFLLALRHGLDDLGMKVIGKNDPGDGTKQIRESGQVLLANAITFKGKNEILEDFKAEDRLALVHRVDGPYYVARYFRTLNFKEPEPLPKEDKKTQEINDQYACATVFQSKWSIDANFKIGLNLKNPVVIPNMIDETLFYPPPKPRAKREGRKLRIVASSHSDNVRKGFDTMLWLDQNLDFDKYELLFMGGHPKDFIPKRGLQVLTELGSEAVADFLRSGDIYFAPSRFEPASNAVSEALACGLPVLYQEGSSHGDLVGKAGVGFESTGPSLIRALEQLVSNYDEHASSIYVPSMRDITESYLSTMRWCFYMRHLMLFNPEDSSSSSRDPVPQQRTPQLPTPAKQAPQRSLRNQPPPSQTVPKQRSAQNPRNIFVDKLDPNYQPLTSEFLLGNYSRHEAHGIDAVIMAAAPDSALAINVHNLYHLQGFRRFIFVVNDAQAHCPWIFDLVPQHAAENEKKHMCLEHNSFYTDAELKRLWDVNGQFQPIHDGPPEKVLRAGKYISNPRMGWYLQQFSKMLIPRLVPDLSDQYLAIDSDIIPVRPLEYISKGDDGRLDLLMPQCQKPPVQWRDFSRLVLPDIERDKKYPRKNYVVGWMIFDQTVLSDLIDVINHALVQEKSARDPFPFNVLQVGNELIKQNNYFSEFYTYAMFAFNQTKVNYVEKFYERPLGNSGMHESCVLNQTTYQQAQDDSFRPPWKLWEEHKYHRFDSCPEGEAYFNFSTIGIWHDFHPPPWGGGNQFLLALRHGLDDLGMTVIGKNDPGDGTKQIRESGQVLLANAITFKGKNEILEDFKAEDRLALVHRVDGPYYVARYFRTLNFTEPEPLPKEDKKTQEINDQYACATVFQSKWSTDANIKIGLNLKNPVVIPNMIDETLFYPPKSRPKREGRKLRIVASSHSGNPRKGFDTMMWLDQNLDFEKYELLFMGGHPDDFVSKRGLQILTELGSEAVADFLRSGDIYFAPSRFEPASNAVSEAMACGLPVLYQEGSSHGDLVGKAGVGFASTGLGLLEALERLVANYDEHAATIYVPSMKDITVKYLSVMRWCFFMRHLMLENPESSSSGDED